MRMHDPKAAQWLDWHIDTRIVPADDKGPTLRLIKNDVIRGEVPITAGEMANLERRFREKVQAQEAVKATGDDAD